MDKDNENNNYFNYAKEMFSNKYDISVKYDWKYDDIHGYRYFDETDNKWKKAKKEYSNDEITNNINTICLDDKNCINILNECLLENGDINKCVNSLNNLDIDKMKKNLTNVHPDVLLGILLKIGFIIKPNHKGNGEIESVDEWLFRYNINKKLKKNTTNFEFSDNILEIQSSIEELKTLNNDNKTEIIDKINNRTKYIQEEYVKELGNIIDEIKQDIQKIPNNDNITNILNEMSDKIINNNNSFFRDVIIDDIKPTFETLKNELIHNIQENGNNNINTIVHKKLEKLVNIVNNLNINILPIIEDLNINVDTLENSIRTLNNNIGQLNNNNSQSIVSNNNQQDLLKSINKFNNDNVSSLDVIVTGINNLYDVIDNIENDINENIKNVDESNKTKIDDILQSIENLKNKELNGIHTNIQNIMTDLSNNDKNFKTLNDKLSNLHTLFLEFNMKIDKLSDKELIDMITKNTNEIMKEIKTYHNLSSVLDSKSIDTNIKNINYKINNLIEKIDDIEDNIPISNNNDKKILDDIKILIENFRTIVETNDGKIDGIYNRLTVVSENIIKKVSEQIKGYYELITEYFNNPDSTFNKNNYFKTYIIISDIINESITYIDTFEKIYNNEVFNDYNFFIRISENLNGDSNWIPQENLDISEYHTSIFLNKGNKGLKNDIYEKRELMTEKIQTYKDNVKKMFLNVLASSDDENKISDSFKNYGNDNIKPFLIYNRKILLLFGKYLKISKDILEKDFIGTIDKYLNYQRHVILLYSEINKIQPSGTEVVFNYDDDNIFKYGVFGKKVTNFINNNGNHEEFSNIQREIINNNNSFTKTLKKRISSHVIYVFHYFIEKSLELIEDVNNNNVKIILDNNNEPNLLYQSELTYNIDNFSIYIDQDGGNLLKNFSKNIKINQSNIDKLMKLKNNKNTKKLLNTLDELVDIHNVKTKAKNIYSSLCKNIRLATTTLIENKKKISKVLSRDISVDNLIKTDFFMTLLNNIKKYIPLKNIDIFNEMIKIESEITKQLNFMKKYKNVNNKVNEYLEKRNEKIVNRYNNIVDRYIEYFNGIITTICK